MKLMSYYKMNTVFTFVIYVCKCVYYKYIRC